MSIHIDHLVVDTASARRHDVAQVQAAMEAELAVLFAAGRGDVAGGMIRSATSAPGAPANARSAEELGTSLARGIHSAVMRGGGR